MDLILIPKKCLFYCHSNDKKSLKSLFFGKRVVAINIIVIKTNK